LWIPGDVLRSLNSSLVGDGRADSRMSENLTETFIDDLYGLTKRSLHEAVNAQARMCVLDYLGVTFAGAKMLEEKGGKLLDQFGSLPGDATVIGFNRKSSIHNAVLLNGMSSHVAELDDGDRFGMIHPGTPIISALLPLAEKENIQGKDLLLGLVVGYEAAIRIATALQPSMKERGYHATGVCGAIGAAIGVSAALGFSKVQMRDALSSAGTAASGILKVIHAGSELKPFNAGQAALSGLIAAFVARAGFAGHNDVLSGDIGFLSIMAEEPDISHLHSPGEETLRIEKIYRKPYAACRYCHPCIEAAINIRKSNNLIVEQIKSIKVLTHRWAVAGHDHSEVDGVNSAKMSIPYSVAVALWSGRAGLQEFMLDQLNHPDILRLMKLVEVVSDEGLTALVPEKRPAIVEVRTYNNECYRERIDLPRGEPETALSEEEVKKKFISLALFGGKTEREAHEIIKIVENLDSKINQLYSFL